MSAMPDSGLEARFETMSDAWLPAVVAVEQTAFTDKLVAADRILSVSERYVLTTYAAGRLIYWEYEGGMPALAAQLERAGLLAAAPLP